MYVFSCSKVSPTTDKWSLCSITHDVNKKIVNRSIHGLEARQTSKGLTIEGDLEVHKSFVRSLLIFEQHYFCYYLSYPASNSSRC